MSEQNDLISRKSAVSRMSDLLMLELKGERLPTWNEVYRAMGDIPPAQPQPEIIRCKDCKYYVAIVSSGYHALGKCNYLQRGLIPNDVYCAWAERREESNA